MFLCGTVHLQVTITKLRSDAFGPGCHQLAALMAIYAHLSIDICSQVLLVGARAGVIATPSAYSKASEHPPDRQGDKRLAPK